MVNPTYKKGFYTLAPSPESYLGDLKADGTVPLTANWDVGAFGITALSFTSDIATVTGPPFTITSTTAVTNLNADLLDGSHASAFALAYAGLAIGDILCATSATAVGSLAAVAAGQILASAGTTTKPAYTASPTLTGTLTASNLIATPTLATELVVWDSGTGAGTGWTWTGGVNYVHSSGTTAFTEAHFGANFAANTQYKIVIGYTWSGAASTITVSAGGQVYTAITSAAASSITYYLTASASTALKITPTDGFTGSINSISIQVETNGVLTATTATITNGMTLNSGQLLIPYGSASYPILASIRYPTTGMYFESDTIKLGITGLDKLSVYADTFNIKSGTIMFGDSANGTIDSTGWKCFPKQITAAAGTGITVNDTGNLNRQVYKVTTTYLAYETTANSLTQDLVIATLPAKTKIVGFYADTTIAYAGADTVRMTVGKSAGGVEYIADHDVKTGVVTKGLLDADMGTELVHAASINGGAVVNWSATIPVTVRITTTTQHTDDLSAGSTTFYIITERY